MKEFKLDMDSKIGARTLQRLTEDLIIWLVTVREDGTPQPSPVWFLWNGETISIFSQPGRQKLRNIKKNAKVALHFDSDGHGGDIVIINGNAEVVKDMPPANEVTDYLNKYKHGLEGLNMTPESFAGSYSVPIRITPYSLRGH